MTLRQYKASAKDDLIVLVIGGTAESLSFEDALKAIHMLEEALSEGPPPSAARFENAGWLAVERKGDTFEIDISGVVSSGWSKREIRDLASELDAEANKIGPR